jgi:putative ABC transport system permease protein
VLVGLTSHGHLATALVGGGAAVLFIGVAALSPVLARPVARVVGGPLPALFGVPGRLGLRNALRDPRRTAATASALMVGLALVSMFAIFGQSVKTSVRQTVLAEMTADYFISPNGGTIDSSVAPALGRLPGVAAAIGIHGGTLGVGGRSVPALAADGRQAASVFMLTPAAGTLALADGQLALSVSEAVTLHLSVGDRVPVTFPDTTATMTVAGVFSGRSSLVAAVVTPADWARHSPNTRDSMILVRRAPGADPAVVSAAVDRAVAAVPGLAVADQAAFVAAQEQTVDQLVGLVYVLLALAVVIALFGIVNTLALSMTERIREIGMLRAVGLRRGQLRLAIVLESVVISLFGATLGVGVGSFLGWALVRALRGEGLTTFAYPVRTIVEVLAVGGLLGVLAAVLPAVRAARMNILRAIATA